MTATLLKHHSPAPDYSLQIVQGAALRLAAAKILPKLSVLLGGNPSSREQRLSRLAQAVAPHLGKLPDALRAKVGAVVAKHGKSISPDTLPAINAARPSVPGSPAARSTPLTQGLGDARVATKPAQAAAKSVSALSVDDTTYGQTMTRWMGWLRGVTYGGSKFRERLEAVQNTVQQHGRAAALAIMQKDLAVQN